MLPARLASSRLLPILPIRQARPSWTLHRSFQQLPRHYPRQLSDSNPRTLPNGNDEGRRPWTKEEVEPIYAKKSYIGCGLPPTYRVKTFEEHKTEYSFLWLTMLVALVLADFGLLYMFGYVSDAEPLFKPPKFTPFTIISKEDVSPTSFILTLRPSRYLTEYSKYLKISQKSAPYSKEWEKGTWSVEFKQPQLQIARSYTPLPPREADEPADLRFLIRYETNGEMSRYIAQLPVGEQVELRGPHEEFALPEDVTDVLFLAGGTGIAPALQVAHTLLDVRKDPAHLPKIHIIWANRRREDCVGGSDSNVSVIPQRDIRKAVSPVVKELQKLQQRHPETLKVDYLVDEESTFLDAARLSQATKGVLDVEDETRTDSKLLLVSGPEGFVNFLAGPKRFLGGEEVQGEVGGIIGRLGLRGWTVFKH